MAQMTGNDLLEALKEMTPEQLALPVVTEGCDCDGEAHSIVVDRDEALYIGRTADDGLTY